MELTDDFIKRMQAIADAFRKLAEMMRKSFERISEDWEEKKSGNKPFSKIPSRAPKKHSVKKSFNIQRKVLWYTYKYKF